MRVSTLLSGAAMAAVLFCTTGMEAMAQGQAGGKGTKQRGKQQSGAQGAAQGAGAPSAAQGTQQSVPSLLESAPRVHAALDQIEKAFQDRDVAAMERLTSDQMVAVIEPEDRKGDPTVYDKKGFIGLIKASFEKGAALPEHRFTDRSIELAGRDVMVRTTVVDRWPDGRVQSSKGLRLMHPENGEWKVLFAMPDPATVSVCVRHPMPRSVAREMGIVAGDVIVSYAGVRAVRSNQLADLVRMNSTSPSAPQLALVVSRDGVEKTFQARPGMLGVSLEDRLLPDAEGELVGAGRAHPAKEAFARQLLNMQQGAWAAFASACSARGALVFGPGVIGPVVSARALEESANATNFKTVEWFDVNVIVRGGLAISSARAVIRQQNNEFAFVSLEGIHVRQGADWPMVSFAPGRTLVGPVPRPTPETSAIAGEWEWFNGGDPVVMLPDGILVRGGKWSGYWVALDPAARRYMISWGQMWFDDVTLSPDGTTLTGRNNKNGVVWGKRTKSAGDVK